MSYWAENWSSWVGAALVFAIYSYLWKDNPVYRVTMQVFIGVNVGYQVVIQCRDILYPQWWIPMIEGFRALFLGGSGSPWGALWAVAGLLGLCWYFQMSRKYMWLSRLVMGVVIGISAGVTIKSQLGTNLPQLADSFKPLAPAAVGPRPRELFILPLAETPPLIGTNVGYFGARDMVCVEMLGGRELWRSSRPSGNGALDEKFRVQAQNIFFSDLGAPRRDLYVFGEKPELFYKAQRIAEVTGEPLLYSDADNQVALVPVKEGFAAFDLPSGRQRWRRNSSPVLGQALARSYLLTATEDGALLRTDITSGKTTSLRSTRDISGAPIPARFPEPLEDLQYVVVPVRERSLAAIQIADDAGFNRRTGEVLWQTQVPYRAAYGASFDGQIFITGPEGGRAYELPRPTKKLIWTDYLDNLVFTLTLLSVMTYFFFSFRRKSLIVEKTSVLGRYMLMIGFGAFFGNTVMTRMSYLVDRLMFLSDEWLRPLIRHFFG